MRLSGRSEDSDFPVLGRLGGKNGRGYGLEVNGKRVDHGIYRRLNPGDKVHFQLSGGGGYGDPRRREPERVARDVAEGYVTVAGARKDYAVALDSNNQVNLQETEKLRKA